MRRPSSATGTLRLAAVIVSLLLFAPNAFGQQDSPVRTKSQAELQVETGNQQARIGGQIRRPNVEQDRNQGGPDTNEEVKKVTSTAGKLDRTSKQPGTNDEPEGIEHLRQRLDEIERVTRAEIEMLRQLVLQQGAELAALRQQPQRLGETVRPLNAELQQAGPTSPSNSLSGELASGRPPEASHSSPPETAAVQATPPQEPEGEISGAARRDTFRRDNESVARVNNKRLDPSSTGFFDIPGTSARLKLDGYFKLDTIVDPRPVGDPEQFNTARIPISQPGDPQPASVSVFARQTRFNLDFHSGADNSEHGARVFLEFDFFGGDGATDPRLRHAYGQYRNFLVGHTWSTFTDPDAFPDTLDFEMPASVTDVRQAQVRFTLLLNPTNSLAFAIERPGVSAARTLVASGRTYNPAPDSVVRWRFENKRGHIQVGSVLRALGYQDDTRSETVFGYGVNVAAAVKVFGLNSVQVYGSYGKGYGRYIKNISSYDVDLDNSGRNIRAMPALGTYLAYSHHWARALRSTVTFGYDRVQNTAAQPGNAFSKSYYMSSNLIWNPLGHLHLGAEFLHGWQVQKNGSQGNANRIQFSVKYDLYQKQ